MHEALHGMAGEPEMPLVNRQAGSPARGTPKRVSMLASPLVSVAVSQVEHLQVSADVWPATAGGSAWADRTPADQVTGRVGFVAAAVAASPANPVATRSRADLSRLLSLFLKDAMDVLLGILLLILAAPCFLAIMAVSSLDGGPIFFAHRRIGAGGRYFHCLKFRTMVVDADRVLKEVLAQDPVMTEEWIASRKLSQDPRVTPLGRFLRKTSLDELPQLINVLRRDMSLVGPRPIVENEIHLYGKNIADYYTARPGLTGLWQISGRSNVSYGRRVELDTWYVNNRTIWRDLTVLLKTVPIVWRRQGAW